MKNVIKTIAVLSLLGLSNSGFSATDTTGTLPVVGEDEFASAPASKSIDNRDKNMAIQANGGSENAKSVTENKNTANLPTKARSRTN